MPFSKHCVPIDELANQDCGSLKKLLHDSPSTVADKPKVNTSAVMQNAVRRLAEIFQNVRTIQKNTTKERWARPVASGQDSR